MWFKLSQLEWRSSINIDKCGLQLFILMKSYWKAMHTASCVPYGDYITVGVGGGDWSGQSRCDAKALYFLHDLCLHHLWALSWNAGLFSALLLVVFCCIVLINMVIVASEMTQDQGACHSLMTRVQSQDSRGRRRESAPSNTLLTSACEPCQMHPHRQMQNKY